MRWWLPAVSLVTMVGCEPAATSWEPVEELAEGEPFVQTADTLVAAPDNPSSLKVMTWNIKFGGGRIDFFFDGHDNIVHMTEPEVLDNLEGLRELIAQQDPDVLMCQEVDVESKRSAYIDMVDWILNNTDMNYAMWVPAWQSRFVAEDGLGPVKMGQAVFSKYPLQGNTRVDLPQPGENSAIINYFYLHRAIQITSVDTGERGLVEFHNQHPTAYAVDGTRELHLAEIQQRAAAATNPVVVGGDMNVPPPGTFRLSDFPDYADTDTFGVQEVVYTEAELQALEPFYERYEAVVPVEEYSAAASEEEQSKWFTHSISGDVFWVMKLDYLWTDLSWSDGHTLQKPGDGSPALEVDPMQLSDHAPLVGILELP